MGSCGWPSITRPLSSERRWHPRRFWLRLALNHQTAKLWSFCATRKPALRLALNHQTAKLTAIVRRVFEQLRLALNHQTAKLG